MSAKKSDAKPQSQTDEKDVNDENYYIGIAEPLEIRRTLLETSKSIIQAMHRYEKYKSYRDEKLQLLKKLNKDMSEVSGMITTLKAILPKQTLKIKRAKEEYFAKIQSQKVSSKSQNISVAPEVLEKTDDLTAKDLQQIRQVAQSRSKVITSAPKKELSELERLELELSEIESKLSTLSK